MAALVVVPHADLEMALRADLWRVIPPTAAWLACRVLMTWLPGAGFGVPIRPKKGLIAAGYPCDSLIILDSWVVLPYVMNWENIHMITDDEKRMLLQMTNPLRRKVTFIGLLSREVKAETNKMPIVVGGHAVEVFTQGGYTSLDIDVKGPQLAIERVLDEAGFQRDGMHSVHEELDIYIQWLGEGPDPLSEDPDRLMDVKVGDGLVARFIGFEDLIIDRLMQATYWNVTDAQLWAERVLEAALAGENTELDLDYLRGRAEKEGVADVLKVIEANLQVGT